MGVGVRLFFVFWGQKRRFRESSERGKDNEQSLLSRSQYLKEPREREQSYSFPFFPPRTVIGSFYKH